MAHYACYRLDGGFSKPWNLLVMRTGGGDQLQAKETTITCGTKNRTIPFTIIVLIQVIIGIDSSISAKYSDGTRTRQDESNV